MERLDVLSVALPGVGVFGMAGGAVRSEAACLLAVRFPAKLNVASEIPARQSVKARKRRGLKMPDSEVGFFLMR
jgi:hypothetical protein